MTDERRRKLAMTLLIGAMLSAVFGVSNALDDYFDRAFLRRTYGEQRVRQEGLHIVSYKPYKVSNGDVVRSRGWRHDLPRGLSYLPAVAAVCGLVIGLAPASYRRLLKPDQQGVTDVSLACILAIVAASCVTRTVPWAMGALCAVALGLMWLMPALTHRETPVC